MPAGIDEIIRSRRKTIAIIVQHDGKVIVRAPLKAPVKLINAFVESKSTWINQKKALALQITNVPKQKYITGEKFWLLGEQIPLRLVDERIPLTLEDEFLLSKHTQPDAVILFEKWYKKRALKIISERVNYFASMHGFHYVNLRITSARTRWGSCSSRGTLSFTWRLIMAPLNVVDYVVIHELAHLKIKNHSVTFWNEVARLLPTYKSRRDWLKKNGHLLTLDGG